MTLVESLLTAAIGMCATGISYVVKRTIDHDGDIKVTKTQIADVKADTVRIDQNVQRLVDYMLERPKR